MAYLTAHAGLSTIFLGPKARPKPFLQTLSARAQIILARMRLLERFQDLDFPVSFTRTSAWGTAEIAEIESLCNPWGPEWFVRQPLLEELLIDAAIDSNATYSPLSLLRAAVCPEGWALTLSDGTVIHARFVIDGSGRCSVFARQLGAIRRRIDRLVGFVASVERVRGQASSTFVESVADGWWYIGLAPNGDTAAIYFTDADLPAARRTSQLEGWKGALDETLHARLMIANPHEKPHVLNAASEYLLPCGGSSSDWIAIGDAQATCDPLSSEGLFHALQSSELAAAAVIRRFEGDSHAVGNYWLSRQLRYLQYVSDRSHIYSMEHRWNRSAFWERRKQVAVGRRNHREASTDLPAVQGHIV